MATGQLPMRLAALDLGSNSFHLLVAERAGARWRPLQRLGEKVQLAAGMRDGELQADAIERGLACLRRFLPLLRDLPANCVRVVGTQALRTATNRDAFLKPAQTVLQRPIEVISGDEEARLIYSAVATERPAGARLVVDIGGGSTELVSGCGERIQSLQSVAVGCVGFIAEHFPSGRLDPVSMRRARVAACSVFSAAWPTRAAGMDVVGCSGTLLAVGEVLRCNGWGCGGIDRAGLSALSDAVLEFRELEAVCFDGLCESRRSVFASGLAIVQGLFDALALEHMELSDAALREGMVAALATAQPALAS